MFDCRKSLSFVVKIMRRWAFYLSVALLAFGIGSFVVFKFYLKIEMPSVQVETSQINQLESRLTLSSAIEIDHSISKLFRPLEEICAETKCIGDGTLNPLIKKWLKNKNLKGEQISLWTLKERQSMSEKAASPSLVDLNSDGNKELILEFECAPVGNCQFIILSKKGKRYSNLLKTSMVQVFDVLEASTNNFKDLHLRTHGSAFDSYHRLMKFNGKKYVQKKCWEESYEKLDENGVWHQLENPIITSTKCSNDF
jgi:hypothetical protein